MDLANTRFNSATLQTRAKAMIDYVFSRINPANVTHLVMGNEIVEFTSVPIHIEEVGYSSSTTNAGTEDLQT
ncbi:MAG: hypothetical protein J0M15_13750 [Deltaproteobacteria bacterium]|nr:hypothetical protein [Deltaproteobacteria bacterium]